MKKKILFVITKSNFGGAQRYVYDLATHLPEKFESVVVCGSADTMSSAGDLVEKLKDSGVRTILLPELSRDVGFSDFAAFQALLATINKEKPDVLHLNSSKAGGLGALAGRMAEKMPHIIFTAHGWPFWEDRNIFARAAIFLVSWVTVMLSHRTICISGYDRASMGQAPFTSRKIAVVRNGIEPYHLSERKDARDELFTDEEQKVHAGDIWVLTNAEMTPNKNLFRGVDAVAMYNAKNVRKIYWALMHDGEERQALAAYVHAQGMSAHVKFLGYVPDGRREYKAFDIFFLPSRKEGLPYVLLEAGIASLPVAATHVGGIPELVGDGVEGALGNPNNTESLCNSIRSAVEHPEFGTALHSKVSDEYSLERMVRETLTLYR